MSTPLPSRHDVGLLIGLLAICFAVAAIGGITTVGNVDGWYADADKPPFNPPSWLFAPVWTALYAAMAVAAWLVARGGESLRPWWIQLALNALWTPVFFAGQWLWAALVVIVALDVAVAYCLVRFWRASNPAGALFVPYLAWVLFATALNAATAAAR